MSGPNDTEPSPAPAADDAELLDAIAGDLATLEATAHTLGDGLHELVGRLQRQAADLRGKP